MEDFSELEQRLARLEPTPLSDTCRLRIGRAIAARRRRRLLTWAGLLVAAAAGLLIGFALLSTSPPPRHIPKTAARPPEVPPNLRCYTQAWQESDAALFALLDQHSARLLPRAPAFPSLAND